MTHRCEYEAEAARFERLFLYTERAADYYRRFGWRSIDEASYEGERVTVMKRDLSAAGVSRQAADPIG